MCQLLSYYHTISPLSVLYPTPGCWSQESKPHSCLVSSLQVGLCQQGTPGNLGSWWREKGLGSFSKVHVDFLILSGSPLSHFTLAEAIESDRNSQIQFAVSLNWQEQPCLTAGHTSMKQEAPTPLKSGFQAHLGSPPSFQILIIHPLPFFSPTLRPGVAFYSYYLRDSLEFAHLFSYSI